MGEGDEFGGAIAGSLLDKDDDLEIKSGIIFSYLIEMREADSLPPFHSDGDDQEDADREGEVAAALKEGEDESDEGVSESKVIRKHKKIRK